eukprot:TRINITY_DN3468_c0_g1_i2.p2 TRINITY_DN3468_c0_g1~~TRINITY_DN3468_c0_g1_i2.p2  ORF type:complete len:180 (+),score=30.41 TRINITY_DN3468_c0_g1_i2:76-540(+)
MPAPQLAALAIISKRGTPIFTTVYGDITDEEALWLQCTMVSSLDPAEEKVKGVLGATAAVADRKALPDNKYLGFIMPAMEYRVYGATSNTMVKLLAITKGDCRDQELKTLLKTLHDLYTRYVCNPFYEIDTEITSPKFHKQVDQIVSDTPLKAP